MKIKKNLLKIVKSLDKLDIKTKERRFLLEESYSCLGKTYGFDKNLKKGIILAQEKNLKGKEAYEFLEMSTGKYGLITKEFLSENSNYPLFI